MIEIKQENINLLARYGLAITEFNDVELYLTELLVKKSLINVTERDELTFGKKIGLFSKTNKNKDLLGRLNNLNKKRILLAHGISLESKNSEKIIYHKGESPELTETYLDIVAKEAIDVSNLLQLLLGSNIHIKL